MARNLFGVEKGLGIYQENGDLLVAFLSGTAAPTGTGDQAAAPIGSIYARSGTGQLYQKIANAGNSADWELNGASAVQVGTWRPEVVRALTNETLAAGVRNLTTTPFTDDDNPDLTAADFLVGQYVIGGAGSTPVLYQVTNVSAPNITLAVASNAMVDQDAFVVKSYLPDSPDAQEKQAIVVFSEGVMVKIGDFNWNVADGINLSVGYTAQNGTISSADSVNSAIEKLDGNQQDIQSASGLAQGSTDYGTFTGQSLADAQTSKQLFQRIETLLEQMRGVQATGITAAVTVDSVPHASVKSCKWLVEAFEEATPANRKALEVYALNNGTNVDDTIYAKLKVGSNFNLDISVDISGADMRLRASSSTAGVTVTARRIEVVKSVL
jgi:hypothetical protein